MTLIAPFGVFLIIVTHAVWDTLQVHSVVLKIVRRLCILRREMLVRAICETAVKGSLVSFPFGVL